MTLPAAACHWPHCGAPARFAEEERDAALEQRDAVAHALKSAVHALRSYQYGNADPSLAANIANHGEKLLRNLPGFEL